MKTGRFLSLLLAFILITGFAAKVMAAIPVEVSIGKSTVVTLKEISKRVSLSDPDIADIILISPTEILINGKKIGTTSLIIWNKDGNRTFFDVYVAGDIGDLAGKVANMLGPDDKVEVAMAKDSVVLRGTLKNEETIKRLVALSQAYAPKVINLLKVVEPQQVLLEVKVAQIDKGKLRELGLSFLVKGSNVEVTAPGFVASPGVTGGGLGGPAGFNVTPGITGFDLEAVVPQIGVAHFPSGVAAFLKALATNDLAKVIAEPNLVVRSGEKGSFLAGSRVPVQKVSGVGGEQTISIAYEEVGIKINFAPEVLEGGRIRLKIDPAEVSNIARYISFGGVAIAPEIDTREVRTSVDLNANESLVLAGLLSEEVKKNINKIPLLGDIPILGALFRSTREELQQTELAFFITPRLVKPNAPGEKVDMPGDRAITPEEDKEFNWIPVPGKGADKDKE